MRKLIGIAVCVLCGCAPPPRPAELNSASGMFSDQVAAQTAQRAAPAVFALAQRYYKLAQEDYNARRMEPCVSHSLLAAVKFSTALEHARRLQADERRTKAEEKLAAAKKRLAQQELRRREAEDRVMRLEQIQALRAKLAEEQEKGKAEKAKIAAELEKARAEAEARLAAEQKAAAERLAAEQKALEEAKRDKATQEVLAAAASKLQAAESLEAASFDPNNFGIAKNFLEQARAAAQQKRFEDAQTLAKNAEQKADAAIAASQEQYAKKQEKMKLLAERKALFEDAYRLPTLVRQEGRGVVVSLYDLFAPGKNIVLPERYSLLDQVAEVATRYPAYPVVVEGYTDSVGSDAANLALSQGRAQAVLDYLVQIRKLDFNRVKASGYGSSNPVADNSTAEGRSKNRRVEVIFLFR